MVAGTSRQAYEKIKGKLGDRQQKVYDAIREMGIASNEMIADFLGWPINRVTGRVTELNRFGLLNLEGLGKNKTGYSAKLWSAVDLNDRKLIEMANDCAG